jgi:hypothetical protein
MQTEIEPVVSPNVSSGPKQPTTELCGQRLRQGLTYVLLGTLLFVAASVAIVIGILVVLRVRTPGLLIMSGGALAVMLAGLNVLLGSVFCFMERRDRAGRWALIWSLLLQIVHIGIIFAHYYTGWFFLSNRVFGWFALLPPAFFLLFLTELASEHGDEKLAAQLRQLGIACVAIALAAAAVVFLCRDAAWFLWAYLGLSLGGIGVFFWIAKRIRDVQQLLVRTPDKILNV